MPRTNLLFCLLSMTNTPHSVRNSYGASRYWRCTMFLLGLLLFIFVPDYAEAAFSAPASCTSTPWIYQGSKMQNISCAGQNLGRVPNDSKEGSDVFKFDLSYNQITSLAVEDFQHFINLVILDLSYNEIPSITVDTFSNLTNLQYLNLAANDLSYLPSGTFTAISVETFNVSRNTNLVFGRRKSVTLHVLDLSYLNLGSVTKEHFQNLVNLREVYLSNNNLTSLDRHLFKELTSLETIDLSWNEITELDNNQVYRQCSGLKTLDLSNNIIDNVHQDFLKDADALTNLSVTFLDLSHNRISHLDDTTFEEVPDLEILYLNDNLLTSLDKDLFKGLTSLKMLHLNTNLLTTLHKDLFKELTSLTTLHLDNNLLTVLPTDPFKYNTALQYLSLSANQLSTITIGEFDDQTATFTVDVSGNPFICECTVRDYLYDIKYATSMTLDNEDSIYCTDSSLDQHVYLDYNNANCSGNLGSACTITYECKVRNSQCYNAKCICSDNFYDTNGNTTDGGLCNAKVSLDYLCPGMDTACSGSNVECAVKSPSSSDTYCVCKPLYYDDNPQYLDGTCRLKVELGETCISINNMCRPDYSMCGTSDTCECQSDYYDNNGASDIGGECLEKLALNSKCNETYQCAPSNSECRNSACSCSDGYYDFTNIGQCKDASETFIDVIESRRKRSLNLTAGPSGFYSCYPDSTSSVNVVFAKVKNVSTEDECKNYCFEEDVRYYYMEGTNTCICGDVTSSISCCPKVNDFCSGKTYLGPTTEYVEAGINITHIPRLTAGYAHEFSLTTTLGAIDQINLRFGDSATIETVNASYATVQHTYTHSGLFWLTASACAAAKGVCEDAALPIRVEVAAENLTTYMTGMSLAEVSSNLTASFLATFSQGYEFDIMWTKTYNGVVTKRQKCKPGWIDHRYSCIKLESTPTIYSSAKAACAADGSLLKIDFMDELSEIVTALGASSETVYVGAERVGGVWKYPDGSKTIFSNDHLTDPSSGDCVALVGSTRQLTSISCSTSAKYVCMSDPVSCPYGGDLLSNNYCYVLASTESVSPKNWQDANSYCWSQFGGWLTNVTDATIQAKVTSLLTTSSVSEAWIGLSDQQVEGSYLWADYSSYNYYNPPYLPTVTSNDGDCFVATSADNWNSQDCMNIKDFVCQYSVNIQRQTVPNNVLGSPDIHISAGEDLHHVVPTGSFPTASTSSTDLLLFPGLTFSKSGKILQWNFCSVDIVSGNYDISFQVYRPSCSQMCPTCLPLLSSSLSCASKCRMPDTELLLLSECSSCKL
ncbi:uncharacterized protein LOC123562128 [Mercenaria mercenaria]|uniref:uncharacterized protein LOC123562128 n=1 Tax=Mercenaria mercenaria TaxID=6596 RepID=UPI00234EB975|nr:uncharacterized protein LOC123562128 [Mercenaria mercenaria]